MSYDDECACVICGRNISMYDTMILRGSADDITANDERACLLCAGRILRAALMVMSPGLSAEVLRIARAEVE